ncbi:Formin-like protein 8, partial [Cucurbita argyrosperma subsp. sororia]
MSWATGAFGCRPDFGLRGSHARTISSCWAVGFWAAGFRAGPRFFNFNGNLIQALFGYVATNKKSPLEQSGLNNGRRALISILDYRRTRNNSITKDKKQFNNP